MHYINNKFVGKRNDFNSFNPTDNSVLESFPCANEEEINSALISARNSFDSWRKISRIKRGEYFEKMHKIISSEIDNFANVISLDTGKSLNESKAEVIEILHMISLTIGKSREPIGKMYASELAERDCYIVRKPKGVIVVITAWNFPAALSYWNISPALLEGNVVIWKPSELTSLTAQFVAKIYDEVGFPPGVFTMLHGDGKVGESLIRGDIDHVSFTGSVETGQRVKKICTESYGKSCSCEMGSKSAVIVFEDGNLDLALQSCLFSAFKLSGQRCVSSGRLFIQRPIFDQFKEKFLDQVSRIKVCDPFDKIPENCPLSFGPLINKKQADKVRRFNTLVRQDKDVKILYDGVETDNCYVYPFVYECEWNNKEYLKKEVFGPHVALIPFDTTEEVIKYYNDTIYGLSLGCITNDFKKMRQIREDIKCGIMYMNSGSIGGESHLNFTGHKASGFGGGSALASFDVFVDETTISINHADYLAMPQGLK